MIYLLYTKLYNPLAPSVFATYLRQLPVFIQKKITRFRQWQDAHRSLLGNLLLLKGLQLLDLQEYSLEALKYTEFQKPYFENLVDFNVSHSGDYIVCSISTVHRTGIDVELIKDITIDDFVDNFSAAEWRSITRSDAKLRTFYCYWTQKEAFLKAVGVGLNFPLHKLFFSSGRITWQNEPWYSHEVPIDPDYVCHLVTDSSQPEIIRRKVDFT